MKKVDRSRFAIMNMNYMFYPWEYFLDAMVDMGMPNINIWAGHPHLLIDRTDREKVKYIKKTMQDRGIRAVCFTPEQIIYPFNVADADPFIRESSIKTLLRGLEIASELETELYQVVPGYGFHNMPIDAAWDRAAEAFVKVADYAGKLGLTVILEPLQIVESNLVGDIASAKKMLADVASPHFQLMLDTCHMAVKGENIEDYFTAFGSTIKHIHFNESSQVPCGDGVLPLRHYLDVIEENDYEGTLTLEICSHKYYIDPANASRKGWEYIQKMLG